MSQIAVTSHPGEVSRPAAGDPSLLPLRSRCVRSKAVPTGVPRVLAFLHPIMVLASLAFMMYVASLGLRSRERTEAHLRAKHGRLAVYAYGLMLANLGAGAFSTWYLRPDLELATSAHFRLALVIVAVFSVVALLSRRIARSDSARFLHPILGLIALVLSGLQVFFGMPLLPL